MSPIKRHLPALLLLAAMALTVAAYWVGLRGPFLFDDGPTFSAIKFWMSGDLPLKTVLAGNTSWLTHRSVAMGSFALGAHLFGYTPFVFKLGNLLIHLLCGAVAFRVLTLLARRDPVLSSRSTLVAAAVVAVWLLHPFNASTVLYAVQRMTQIAALSCLLGLWLYVVVRQRIEAGTARHGWATLFVAIPVLTFIGIQGKQNAAVLPGLCLVVELAYFSLPRAWPRPLAWFYGIFIALPALGIAAILALRPDAVLGGYSEYFFTPYERVISQARVLCDYLRMLVLPNPPAMGVYTDDYTVSTGLFSPPSTALCLAFLLAVSIGAWHARRAAPSVFAGWFLFLVGHAVEGSFLPIELYYEHRNYLPALGLLLALAGLAALVARRMSEQGLRMGRIGVAAGVALLAMLAFQTHGRARVWSDVFLMSESAMEGHPDSPRAVLTYVGLAMESGNSERAYAVLNRTIEQTSNDKLRGLAELFRIRVDCHVKGHSSVGALDRAIASLPPHVDLTMVQIAGYARHLIEKGGCTGITQAQLADALVKVVDRAKQQSDTAWPKWMMRHRAASLYLADKQWDKALAQARLAWQPNAPTPVAEVLVTTLLHHGEVDAAEQVYRQAAKRSDLTNQEQASSLARVRTKIDRARADPQPPPSEN